MVILGIIYTGSAASLKYEPVSVDLPLMNNSSNIEIMPKRSDAATMGGKEFLESLAGLSRSEADEAILAQLAAGNVPDFMRRLVPVSFSVSDNGTTKNITILSLPDYFSIGSNDDFVRIPMHRELAERIAASLSLSLPTPTIVDAIYEAANVKLAPKSMGAKSLFEDAARHNREIEKQIAGTDFSAGRQSLLIAGHKKDIVWSESTPNNKEAIYGWHKLSGERIQPLNKIHSRFYADYSHGLRLIASSAVVDGQEVMIEQK